MIRYTVTLDYCATGEGRTVSLLMCITEDEKAAMELFASRSDPFFARCAEVVEGFDFECEIAKFMIPSGVRQQLEDTRCMLEFYSSLHFNYS